MKFVLNKSGYLISVAKDQYFYLTNLKKTDNSPHSQLANYWRGEDKARSPTPFPIFQSSNPPFESSPPLPTPLPHFLKVSTQGKGGERRGRGWYGLWRSYLNNGNQGSKEHCSVKSVQIRSFSGPQCYDQKRKKMRKILHWTTSIQWYHMTLMWRRLVLAVITG